MTLCLPKFTKWPWAYSKGLTSHSQSAGPTVAITSSRPDVSALDIPEQPLDFMQTSAVIPGGGASCRETITCTSHARSAGAIAPTKVDASCRETCPSTSHRRSAGAVAQNNVDFKPVVIPALLPKWPLDISYGHGQRCVYPYPYVAYARERDDDSDAEQFECSAEACETRRTQTAKIPKEMKLQEIMCASDAWSLKEKESTCKSTVTFSVVCETRIGEEIRVVGNVAALGHWDPRGAAAMQWTDGHVWITTVELEFPCAAPLEYKYVMTCNGQVKVWEACENRVLCQLHSGSSLVCHNIWGDLNDLNARPSRSDKPSSLRPSAGAIAQTKVPRMHLSPQEFLPKEKNSSFFMTVTFSVLCQTRPGEEICVVGNVATLGQWDPCRAAAMQWTDGHVWVTTVELEIPSAASFKRLEYKYVMMCNGKVQAWEACENRVLSQLHSESLLVCQNVWGDLNDLAAHHR